MLLLPLCQIPWDLPGGAAIGWGWRRGPVHRETSWNCRWLRYFSFLAGPPGWQGQGWGQWQVPVEGGNADLLTALVTRGISTFAATGSNALHGRSPPMPIVHTTQLEVSHQGYATAVLAPFCLGAPWGQHLPSRTLLVGHSSLTSSLCSGEPACFSAGKQGAALLVLTPRQRSLVPEGSKPAVCLAPARHVPQGIMTAIHWGAFWLSSTLSPPGLFGYTTLAILKNSSAASRAMSRSCQSNGVL